MGGDEAGRISWGQIVRALNARASLLHNQEGAASGFGAHRGGLGVGSPGKALTAVPAQGLLGPSNGCVLGTCEASWKSRLMGL